MDMDAVALVAAAHGRLLRLLSDGAGKHFQGVSQGMRFFGRQLSSRQMRFALNLEVAYNVTRHVTVTLLKEFEAEMSAAIADRGNEDEEKENDEDNTGTKAETNQGKEQDKAAEERAAAKLAKVEADSRAELDDTKTQLEAGEKLAAEAKAACKAKANESRERLAALVDAVALTFARQRTRSMERGALLKGANACLLQGEKAFGKNEFDAGLGRLEGLQLILLEPEKDIASTVGEVRGQQKSLARQQERTWTGGSGGYSDLARRRDKDSDRR